MPSLITEQDFHYDQRAYSSVKQNEMKFLNIFVRQRNLPLLPSDWKNCLPTMGIPRLSSVLVCLLCVGAITQGIAGYGGSSLILFASLFAKNFWIVKTTLECPEKYF